MRIAALLLIMVVTQAQTFLGEPHRFAPMFIQQEQQEEQQEEIQQFDPTQTAMPPTEEETTLQQQPQQGQNLIAKTYDQNLPANGDCVILYSECNFKGSSKKMCYGISQDLSFDLPISSVYVPLGSQFSMQDQLEGNQVSFIMSENCLLQPLIMQSDDSNADTLGSAESQTFIAEDISEEDAAALKIEMPGMDEYKEPEITYQDFDGNVITKEEFVKKLYDDAHDYMKSEDDNQSETAASPEIDQQDDSVTANIPEQEQQQEQQQEQEQQEQQGQQEQQELQEQQETTQEQDSEQQQQETQVEQSDQDDVQVEEQQLDENMSAEDLSGPQGQVEPLTGQEQSSE